MYHTPKVVVIHEIIDVEFTLADDCRFTICLDKEEATEFIRKLNTALEYTNGDYYRLEIE